MAGLDKVGTGQKLRPKADTWNSFIDVTNYVRQRMMNRKASSDRLREDATPFKNTAVVAIPMFGISWLTDAEQFLGRNALLMLIHERRPYSQCSQ